MPPKRKDEKHQENHIQEFIGVYIFPDGSRYDGQIIVRDNSSPKRHGNGVYTDAGSVYDGQWEDDVMCGEGQITYSTGASFTGNFNYNAFDGEGKYIWTDGTYYEGQWRYNKMHGIGTYCDRQGHRWHGKFYNGRGVELNLEIP
eukprot:Tbor_TRINITY_DN5334_c1_g5::TRINITY_DN5334_c1_g5_i1::g.4596::m.4596